MVDDATNEIERLREQLAELSRANIELERISKMPLVAARRGVGDGSVVDAVTALEGAVLIAERRHNLGVELMVSLRSALTNIIRELKPIPDWHEWIEATSKLLSDAARFPVDWPPVTREQEREMKAICAETAARPNPLLDELHFKETTGPHKVVINNPMPKTIVS